MLLTLVTGDAPVDYSLIVGVFYQEGPRVSRANFTVSAVYLSAVSSL